MNHRLRGKEVISLCGPATVIDLSILYTSKVWPLNFGKAQDNPSHKPGDLHRTSSELPAVNRAKGEQRPANTGCGLTAVLLLCKRADILDQIRFKGVSYVIKEKR